MTEKLVVSTTTAKLPGGKTTFLKTQTSYTINTDGSLVPGKIEVFQGKTTQTSVRSGESITYTLAATATTAGDGLYKSGFTKVEGSTLTDAEFKSLNTTNGVINTSVKTGIKNASLTSGQNEPGLSIGQAQALIGAPQTFANAPQPTPQAGDGETPFTQESANAGGNLLNESGSGIKTRTGTRSVKQYPKDNLLRYPVNMNTDQDYVTFTMLEYVPRKLDISSSTLDILEKRSRSEKQIGSTVVLPIQPTISDTNAVRWGAEDMNALQGMVASVAMKAITDSNNFTATASEFSDIAKGITSGKDSIKTALAAEFAGRAALLPGLLSRVTGGILNPNTELLFNGPELRTFNFNFSLSAREPQEAKNIRNIIRFFKQGMSVKRADTGLFLKAPHTFQIKYFHKGDEHPWIGKIKECALTSCTVNYTPAGNYATYEDGAMTQYDLSLSFSELEPLYDDQDYGSGGGTENETDIGY